METLSALAARFGAPANPSEMEAHLLGEQAPHTSHAELVLAYLAHFGSSPTNLEELVEAIDQVPDEEDLSAFRCAEGVAVTSASDGWWVLFQEPGHG
ncbi:hypothetical protein [Phenylobacterium sp.]|uniref:hypothetical protein n=1 Tax=Phenylobacterium sp. TaxID=1871053 RepID=UPI0035B47911